MTWPGLPMLMTVRDRPVILLGEGDAADAKRRLLDRAGAMVVEDHSDARLAVVAVTDDTETGAAVARLKARGILVNAVDRPALCDWTLPAIVDRAPVLVAVATGGTSAGLAAALRQRIEAILPTGVGRLATALFAARGAMRARWAEGDARRRAIGAALAPGAPLDPLADGAAERVDAWLAEPDPESGVSLHRIALGSADPDDLTLRHARWLALADRVYHAPDVPPAILDRARADAARIACEAPPAQLLPGSNVWVRVT